MARSCDWRGRATVFSKRKFAQAEKREERAASVDIFEPLAGLQGGGTTGEDDVFGERRAVFDADAEVGADGVADWGLEKQIFERLGALKAQEIYVGEAFQLGSDVEVGAGVGEKNSRADEIGLALFFAGAESGYQAAGRSEQNAGAGKANAFAIPEAEQTAGEIREARRWSRSREREQSRGLASPEV